MINLFYILMKVHSLYLPLSEWEEQGAEYGCILICKTIIMDLQMKETI